MMLKAPEKTKGVEIKDPKEPAPKKTKFIIKSSRTALDQSEKVVEKVTKKVVEKERRKRKRNRRLWKSLRAINPSRPRSLLLLLMRKRRVQRLYALQALTSPFMKKRRKLPGGIDLRLLSRLSLRIKRLPLL
ncbi:hypothetical protein Hanom_Chr10g00906291 [Helianthus anomalus]